METIYISNWSKGQNAIQENTLFLIDNFVRTINKYSPNVVIKFLTDENTVSQLSEFVLANTDIDLVLEQFDNHEPHEWPLVKLKTIGLINSEEILHLDYDMIIKTPIEELFRVFRESEYDVIYQKSEPIAHPYYSKWLRANKQQNIFEGVKNQIAYNAGVSYFKTKACRDLYVSTYDFQSESFGDYIALEQMVIPALMERNGIKIGTLFSLVSKFQTLPNYDFQGHSSLAKSDYDYVSRSGCFIPNLGIYHFIGDMKYKPNIQELITQLSELD